MSFYKTHPVSAPWIHCNTCGNPATININVIPENWSKRGKRSLGFYCDPCGKAKLEQLRSKKR